MFSINKKTLNIDDTVTHDGFDMTVVGIGKEAEFEFYDLRRHDSNHKIRLYDSFVVGVESNFVMTQEHDWVVRDAKKTTKGKLPHFLEVVK